MPQGQRTASTPFQSRAVGMANRMNIMKSWRQIAAEVAQEDDPQKLTKLTEELHLALQRELQARLDRENTRAKAA
jgi:hypothetical protein